WWVLNELSSLHPARLSRPCGASPALGHEPFGSETCRRAHVESLRAELLGPNGARAMAGRWWVGAGWNDPKISLYHGFSLVSY
ncbi:MAG: hypothetical protein V3W19_01475, partial [Desulfatiglandales bacterium]